MPLMPDNEAVELSDICEGVQPAGLYSSKRVGGRGRLLAPLWEGKAGSARRIEWDAKPFKNEVLACCYYVLKPLSRRR